MVIVVSKFLNSGEDLFAKAGIKSCCTLNPSMTVGTGGGAGVVAVVVVVVVVVVKVKVFTVVADVAAIVGGADGKVVRGELALPKNKNVKLINQNHLMLLSNVHGFLGKLSKV